MLLLGLYILLGIVLLPLAPLVVLFGGLVRRDWYDGVWARFGFAPTMGEKQPIVVWCASVGEVNTAQRLIRRLAERVDAPVHVATFTPAGLARARDLFGSDVVSLAPLDSLPCVHLWLRRVRPQLLVLFETEIWPTTVLAARRLGVHVAVVNGRLSDRAFPRYRWLGYFWRPVFVRLESVLVQTEVFRERFVALGSRYGATKAVGSLKFDVPEPQPPDDEARGVYERFKGVRPLIVAGSTHAGEERMLAEAVRDLRAQFPALGLVVAPRHLKRCAEAENDIVGAGLSVARRSDAGAAGAVEKDVILVDRIGELSWLYSLATVSFVGGSFARAGGHNVLEPAVVGSPVIVGPRTPNFQLEVETLHEAGALKVARDAAQLRDQLAAVIRDAQLRERMVAGGRRAIKKHHGATERTAERLVVDFLALD